MANPRLRQILVLLVASSSWLAAQDQTELLWLEWRPTQAAVEAAQDAEGEDPSGIDPGNPPSQDPPLPEAGNSADSAPEESVRYFLWVRKGSATHAIELVCPERCTRISGSARKFLEMAIGGSDRGRIKKLQETIGTAADGGWGSGSWTKLIEYFQFEINKSERVTFNLDLIANENIRVIFVDLNRLPENDFTGLRYAVSSERIENLSTDDDRAAFTNELFTAYDAEKESLPGADTLEEYPPTEESTGSDADSDPVSGEPENPGNGIVESLPPTNTPGPEKSPDEGKEAPIGLDTTPNESTIERGDQNRGDLILFGILVISLMLLGCLIWLLVYARSLLNLAGKIHALVEGEEEDRLDPRELIDTAVNDVARRLQHALQETRDKQDAIVVSLDAIREHGQRANELIRDRFPDTPVPTPPPPSQVLTREDPLRHLKKEIYARAKRAFKAYGEGDARENVRYSPDSALSVLNRLLWGLSEWRNRMEHAPELGDDKAKRVLSCLTHAETKTRRKIADLRAEVDAESPAEIAKAKERYLREQMAKLDRYEEELFELNLTNEHRRFIEEIILQSLFEGIGRIVPGNPPRELNDILALIDRELLPIRLRETEVDARVHDTQKTLANSDHPNKVVGVIMPGLRTRSDRRIVFRALVVRGE